MFSSVVSEKVRMKYFFLKLNTKYTSTVEKDIELLSYP